MEQAVAAPMCTRVLADFGARVIKVENPNGGDFARDYDDVVNGPGGLAAHFVWCNRGKESVTLNLKSPAGMDILHRLLDRADALVSNLAPGSTARLGLSAADLAVRPSECHPRRDRRIRPGRPDLAQARIRPADPGGRRVVRRHGVSRTCPPSPGRPMADFTTGLYAALSILALLFSRDRREGPAPAVGSEPVRRVDRHHGLPADLHPALRHRPAAARRRLARRRALRRVSDPRRADRGARHHQRPGVAAGGQGDHRPARPGRRHALRHQHRPVRAPRHSRRGDRILVRAARSRAHPEGGRPGRDRQLAVQPAQRGDRPSAADRPRPLAARSRPPRGRSRRCCRRRSSPVTIRRWGRFPGWASTPTPCSPNSVSDRTTSPHCANKGPSDRRIADAR